MSRPRIWTHVASATSFHIKDKYTLAVLRGHNLPLVNLFQKFSLESLHLQLSFATSALAGRLAALDALLGALGAFPEAPEKKTKQVLQTREAVQGALFFGGQADGRGLGMKPREGT